MQKPNILLKTAEKNAALEAGTTNGIQNKNDKNLYF